MTNGEAAKAPVSPAMRRFRLVVALVVAVGLVMSVSNSYLPDWARAFAAMLAAFAVLIGLVQWRNDGALVEGSRSAS